MKKLRDLKVGDIVKFKTQWDSPVGRNDGVRAVVVGFHAEYGMPYLLEFGPAYVDCGLHNGVQRGVSVKAGWWVQRESVEALVDDSVEEAIPVGTMVVTEDGLPGLPVGTPAVITRICTTTRSGDSLYVLKFGAQFVGKGNLHDDDMTSPQKDCYRLRGGSFKII